MSEHQNSGACLTRKRQYADFKIRLKQNYHKTLRSVLYKLAEEWGRQVAEMELVMNPLN